MDLADELARCGIEEAAPPPVRAPKLRSPWEIVREEYPGARIVRFIDVELGTQEFVPIGTDEKLFDGMTIAHPTWPERGSRTHEEWQALIASFDAIWHREHPDGRV